MTIVRAARFPLLLSAMAASFACGECGDPAAPDGGARDGGEETRHDAGLVDGGVRDGGAQPDGGGLVDAGPGVLPPFAYATTCDVNQDDGAPGRFGVEQAFDGVTFVNPLFMTTWPGAGRLYVVEQGGMIYSFDPSDGPGTKAPFLDLTDIVDAGGERGLLGLAFHPDFATNQRFFVSYTVRDAENNLFSVVSRFTATSSTEADTGSEYEILREPQPYGNHNGGMIAFGPDGYLYFGLGDGGSGGDPDDHGQRTETLLGSLLRIDVDAEDPPRRYRIPAGNPFADGEGGQPEIYAWGLRNPWRWSFDRQTGDLWLADVGQNVWEEVNHVPAATLASGAPLNFGWNTFEGHECFEAPEGEADCSGVTDTYAPRIVYSHDDGVSITGGYVYRGNAMPSARGMYFYGDYGFRSVWAYDPDTSTGHEAPAFTAPENLGSFAEDEDGELYLLGLASGGHIWRVVEVEPGEPARPPSTLGETGCFTDLAALRPATGVVPYDVTMPLWSDGAGKQRWLVLPEGGKITFEADGKWRFPPRTLFIKHFAMDTTRGDPSTRVPLETRFIVVESTGVRGFTYRWRDDGSDADLLTTADTRPLPLTLEAGGEPVPYAWSFPSPGQCLQCHTTASGGVLGLETAMLNGELDYGPVVMNQLEALTTWGLFATPPGDPGAHARFPALTDDDAGADERARAWLHVNCASCHLPGGPTARTIDLRYTTALADMNACDVPPQGADYGIAGVRLIKPGDADASLVHYRAAAPSPPARMPPVGTTLVDDVALAVQRAWIEGLAGCAP